jgi:hypothetical protein
VPLAGVVSGRDKTSIGGAPIGTREGADIAHGNQELGSENRSHTWQASEDPSLGTGDKRHPISSSMLSMGSLSSNNICELSDDRGSEIMCGLGEALVLGRAVPRADDHLIRQITA